MFKQLLLKIEKNRGSKNWIWIFLINIKDFLWSIKIKHLKFLDSIETYRLTKRIEKNNKYISYRAKNNLGKLPDFLIVGAQKSGTTYLWKILKQHPDVEMSPNFLSKNRNGKENKKEVFFFNRDENWQKGTAYYKSLFNDNEKIQGESTPNYLPDTSCHKRMFELLPKARLIILLRNPVLRAYSAFYHIKRIKTPHDHKVETKKSFEENFKNNNLDKNIVEFGFYIDQIENLLRYYPKDQILIIISEQMKKNPAESFQRVCKFLEINYVEVDFNIKTNVGEYDRPMEEETKKMLRKIYEPYNQRLYNFLGTTIKEWEEEKND